MPTEPNNDAPLPPEINKYLSILSKDPNSIVFAPLAEAYRKAGMLDEAIATAQDGLKNHPNYLSGMVALGRAYYEKGMFKEARESLEQVIRMAPDNIIAANILEEIRAKAAEAGQQKVEEPETAEILEVEEVAELTEAEAEEEAEAFQIDEITFEAPEPGLGFTTGTEEPIPVPIEVPNETITEPLEAEPTIEVRPAAPPISSKEAEEATRPRKEITTETIAELYIKQGYLDKAVDIYQTLYNADPDNEEIKSKLDELKQVGRAHRNASEEGMGKGVEIPIQEPSPTLPKEELIGTVFKPAPTEEAINEDSENINRLEFWLEAIQRERRIG